MKSYLCIAGILSILVLAQCEIPPELKSQLDECLKEFELTEESLKSPDFEDTKLKCSAACVLKKGDRLTEGKVSADKELELASQYMPKKVDDTLKEKITDCVNAANEEKDDCAVAGALYKCLYEKYGLWKIEEL